MHPWLRTPVSFHIDKFSQWDWKAMAGSPPFLRCLWGPPSAALSFLHPLPPRTDTHVHPEAAHHRSRASCFLELETQQHASSHPWVSSPCG